MNRLLPFITFLLLTASSVEAQRLKLFRSIIYTAQGERIDGILYDMTDSTVQIVPNQIDINQRLLAGDTATAFDVHYDDINRIVIRRKGHAGRGFLLGGGIGLAYSAGIAVFTHPDGGKGIAAVGDAIRLAAIIAGPIGGAISGTVLSLFPYRIRQIRQNEKAYKTAKARLKWLSVRAQQRVRTTDAANVSNRP